MYRFETLLEFARPEYISDLQINRTKDQGLLKVLMRVDNYDEGKSIELSGFDDLAESISHLLAAERVLISEEVGTGKEFGTIRIECWDEDFCYSEFWCDGASLKNT